MKKKPLIWGMLILLIVGILVAGVIWLRIPAGWRARTLLSDVWAQTSASGSITLQCPGFSGEADFSWSEINGSRYIWMQFSGESLYFHNRSLWFDNGRGYDLSGVMEDLGIPEQVNPDALVLAGFQQQKTDSGSLFQTQITASRIKQLERFDPDSAAMLAHIPDSVLTLIEENGLLTGLSLDGTDFSLEIRLFDTPGSPIPTQTVMQIGAAEPTDLRELYPLFSAGRELLTLDVIGVWAQIQLNYGLLAITDNAQLYGTDDGVYYVRDRYTAELYPEGITASPELLLGLGATLCREGTWESTGEDSGILTLSPETEDLDQVLISILPEIQESGITLTDGELILYVEANRISTINLSCSGTTSLLIASIPLELNITMDRMGDPVELPSGIS